jgi:hypothetical protein
MGKLLLDKWLSGLEDKQHSLALLIISLMEDKENLSNRTLELIRMGYGLTGLYKHDADVLHRLSLTEDSLKAGLFSQKDLVYQYFDNFKKNSLLYRKFRFLYEEASCFFHPSPEVHKKGVFKRLNPNETYKPTKDAAFDFRGYPVLTPPPLNDWFLTHLNNNPRLASIFPDREEDTTTLHISEGTFYINKQVDFQPESSYFVPINKIWIHKASSKGSYFLEINPNEISCRLTIFGHYVLSFYSACLPKDLVLESFYDYGKYTEEG